MTKQEVFNLVVRALAKQGVKSIAAVDDPRFINIIEDDRPMCLYRGPNGTKCAIGHLITDDKYTPDLEGENIYNRQGVLPKGVGEHIDFLLALQGIHDESPTHEWQNDFSCLANAHRLAMPQVNWSVPQCLSPTPEN